MARTAYEEALLKIGTGELPAANSSMPSYMVASDTLNIGNQNQTFLESVGSTIADVPSFIGVSMLSGANQIYNIPADVGNFVLGAGSFERSDTAEVISSIDSNLGAFYEEHQGSADLVGFLVSSLVPGLAGIRVLSAGQKSLRVAIQAGKFGKNTGRAFGLLLPRSSALTRKALQDVASNRSVASLTNRNSLKAIAAGAHQGVLEAIAFESFVGATLFNSPILEDHDFGDFIANIAFSAGVFGLVGGTVNAVKLKFALTKTESEAAIAARPYTFIDEAAAASPVYARVAFDFEQISKIPKEFPKNVTADRLEFLKTAVKTKTASLENRIRTNLGELAGGDQAVAEAMFQTFKRAHKDDQLSAFIGMVESSKMGATSKVINRAEKIKAKMGKGTATAKEIEEFAKSDIRIAWAKMHGEDAGLVLSERPIVTALIDTIKKGEVIKVNAKGVTAGSKKYPFDLRFNKGTPGAKAWNIATTSALEADARYIWAAGLPKFAPTPSKLLTVHVDDIPLMEKVLTDLGDDALMNVRFAGLKDGEVIANSLEEFIGIRKIALANARLRIAGEADTAGKSILETVKGTVKAKPLVQDEIASIVNVKSSLLSGDVVKSPTTTYHATDVFARQANAEAYTQKLIDQGSWKKELGLVRMHDVPQHVKLAYNLKLAQGEGSLRGINNFVVENMMIIKEQQKLYQMGLGRASGSALGTEFYSQLVNITRNMIKEGALPSGAGHTFLGAASNNYGSLAAFVEHIGGVTSRAITAFKEKTALTLQPLLYKLGANKEAAIEWSTLNARVRSIEGEYGLNAAGDALEPLVKLRWEAAVSAANAAGTKPPKFGGLSNPKMPARIELNTKEVRDLAKTHIEINSARTGKLAGLRTAGGMQFNRSPDVFYPIPIDPRDFPHFAMVIDRSITSGNQSKTLFATTAEELADAMAKIKKGNPQLEVLTKNEAEKYYTSRGQWDYEKTLSDNYLDVAAHRSGASAPFIVATEPKKIVDDMLTWHLQRETGLVREAVATKYEIQFEELKRLGDEFTNIATSKFSSLNLQKFAEDTVKNPFADYIKTALAIRKNADYPWWVNVNQLADAAFSNMFRRVATAVDSAKGPKELAEVNKLLEQAGYKGAYYDEGMEIFANTTKAQGVLSSVVQRGNSLMATVVLRWDALNAVVNAVSANVLLGAETKAVIRAISRGDEKAAGELAALTRIAVPGTGETIFSAHKLIANSMARFNRGGVDFKFYKDNGYMTRISDQYRGALDDLTYNAKESLSVWDDRINGLHKTLKDLGNKGEQWTGNRLAEEFNRFVAADVMKQMTDVAVSRDLMTAKEQLAYINTFVNRTQGNYLAAQRPMMFQGPIGQAMGLFQTYQFNLIQQLLRHVGEGHAKDAMTLLALQGTIHGMNGLPAFRALNTHLIGTASGNDQHRDTYDAVYGLAGKTAGDWIMYGFGSNALGLLHPDLKVNLYTRGDINPRHLTIVPFNPNDVPIVQGTYKVMANIFATAKKLGAGGDVVTTLLQGLEHNGISRPLAGLAQTLEGLDNPNQASYSTSKRGNVIATNDLLSWANLGRIVGGKPLDEAIALDATYRYKAYGLEDEAQRQVLGEAIKSTLIAGKNPSQEQIEEFAMKYTESGGRQEEFNRWFTQLYKTANLSQATEIQNSLRSPFTESMQLIMGGRELRDFTP